MKDAPILAISLLGWTALLVLFPRWDPAAEWDFRLERGAALQKAGEMASSLGYPSEYRRVGIRTQQRKKASYLLTHYPDSPAASLATPIHATVRFDYGGDQGLSVVLGRAGRVIGFEKHQAGSGGRLVAEEGGGVRFTWEGQDEETEESDPPQEISLEAAQQMMREALTAMLGAEADPFRPKGEPAQKKDSLEFTWQAESLADGHATPEASFAFRKGALAEVNVGLDFSDPFDRRYSSLDFGVQVLTVIGVLTLTLALLAGLAFYLVGSVDREIRHRQVLRLVLLLIPFKLVFFVWGGGWDGSLLDDDPWWEMVLVQFLYMAFVALPLAGIFWGVGYMFSVRTQAARVVTGDLLIQGGLRLRPVGRSIAWGVLAGGAFAAAPYIAGAIVPGALVAPAEDQLLLASTPWIAGLDFLTGGTLIWILLVFALLLPVFSNYLPSRPLLAWGLPLALGAVIFSGAIGMQFSGWAALLSGLLMAGWAGYLYRREGLLAVIMMALAAHAARVAYTLAVQPAAGLQFQGLLCFGVLGLLGASAWGIGRWGLPVDLGKETAKREAEAQRALLQRRGERERLLAEFSVARKAQQLMLPERPPEIPGFQLAAACQPAREVGGDLYDFLALEGNRWAVAVADVSGKGVPAALYMTLTKGLLRSVADMTSRPAEIVRRLNQHLFESARRKVFVTLALAVLDPSSGRAVCVRAGHNPPAWRKRESGQTRYLLSSGIGLALTGPRLFDRSLAVEEVHLQEGDSLILYSDGITEAMDAKGREYGEDRFFRVIGQTDELGAKPARDLILEDVRKFTGKVAQSDDLTIVVIKRLAQDVAAAGREQVA